MGETLEREDVLKLLVLLPQGARATFDKKTHRRVWQRTTRLNYFYLAARVLENQAPESVAEDVLNHLEEAQAAMRQAWGAAELKRLSALSMEELSENANRGLRQALGENAYARAAGQPLGELDPELREPVIDELGRQALTEIYRQLLLSVITELWVDYLTQMEALRISIGLEAYAQRDPLVQYKSRAFGLFQDLLSNMRLGVINRMFTFRPRDLGVVQTAGAGPAATSSQAADVLTESAGGDGSQPSAEAVPVAAASDSPSQATAQEQSSSKKRRRRRR
jgi:preprotein translocase subunit SecA